MKRTILLFLTLVLALAGSTAAIAADNDKKSGKDDAKAAAESCKKDGWKGFTDDDGKPFKNQGQCVSYARQGGELVVIDDDDDEAKDDDDDNSGVTLTAARVVDGPAETSLKIVDGSKPWDGYLEGAGFTPGETIAKVTFASDRETLTLTKPVGTTINDDGTFTTERIIYWCSEFHGYGEATGKVTVQDSAGFTYSQTFEMDTHCGPRQ